MHNTKTHICIGQHNYRIDYWHCNKAQCPQFWQVMDFGLGWAVWLAMHWRAQVSSTEHTSAMEQRNTFLLWSNGTHFCYWATETFLLLINTEPITTSWAATKKDILLQIWTTICHSCPCSGLDGRDITIWTTCCPEEREIHTHVQLVYLI